jgi:hypothetical protein
MWAIYVIWLILVATLQTKNQVKQILVAHLHPIHGIVDGIYWSVLPQCWNIKLHVGRNKTQHFFSFSPLPRHSERLFKAATLTLGKSMRTIQHEGWSDPYLSPAESFKSYCSISLQWWLRKNLSDGGKTRSNRDEWATLGRAALRVSLSTMDSEKMRNQCCWVKHRKLVGAAHTSLPCLIRPSHE